MEYTDSELEKRLHDEHGTVVSPVNLKAVRRAQQLSRLASNPIVEKIKKRWHKRTEILKVEDQVLKSYDRMAGVYNEVDEALRNDQTVRFCVYDGKYSERKSCEIYNAQIEYAVREIYEPYLREAASALEVGAGEGTTIQNILRLAQLPDIRWGALELSWSRVAEAKRSAISKSNVTAFGSFVAGSAVSLPYHDNSFDVVFTNGCIEQIKFDTDKAIAECIRVARKKVVFYEPSYELGDDFQRKYMEGRQYFRGMEAILKRLGARIERHELVPYSFNAFCCYAVTVVDVGATDASAKATEKSSELACPKCRSALIGVEDGLYCPSFECSAVFPVMWGIPCLRPQDGVFASKYLQYTE